MLCKY